MDYLIKLLDAMNNRLARMSFYINLTTESFREHNFRRMANHRHKMNILLKLFLPRRWKTRHFDAVQFLAKKVTTITNCKSQFSSEKNPMPNLDKQTKLRVNYNERLAAIVTLKTAYWHRQSVQGKSIFFFLSS